MTQGRLHLESGNRLLPTLTRSAVRRPDGVELLELRRKLVDALVEAVEKRKGGQSSSLTETLGSSATRGGAWKVHAR